MATSILISTFPPFPTLALSVPPQASFSDLYDILARRYPDLPLHSNLPDLVLSPPSGPIPQPHTLLSTLLPHGHDHPNPLVSLRLVPRLPGGKGGFGSQLRAAGGRMSSQKTSNNDSCRDLSGRRLSTIKEAKKLAEYIESEPLRKKAQQEAQKAKLEALERKLGISADSSSSDPSAGKKRRLEDNDYIEQSREIVDNVKSAVSAAMLKKKKKAKTTHHPPAAPAATEASDPDLAPPAAVPVAATATAAVSGA